MFDEDGQVPALSGLQFPHLESDDWIRTASGLLFEVTEVCLLGLKQSKYLLNKS